MKKFIFFILGIIYSQFFPSNSNAQTGWVQQNSGTFCNLNSVSFVNFNTGYVAGDSGSSRGVILKTSDGGSNWIRQINTSNALSSVMFVDANTGFACGAPNSAHVFFKTTNGGSNWTGGQVNDQETISLLFFINSLTGFQVGFHILVKFGIADVLRTTDGGANWSLQSLFQLADFSSVCFPDAITGYVGGNSPFFKTTNSGISWIQINGPPSSPASIYFINGTTGWAVSRFSSNIYKTTNGGATQWITLSNPAPCTAFYCVKFANEQTGWVCGCIGSIYGTTNGGNNWVLQSSGVSTLLRSLSFVNDQTGWAVGDFGRILKTTNGGVTGMQPISNEVPLDYTISQNYPNPFNPVTSIRFNIASVGAQYIEPLQLKVFDNLGHEIAVLVNQQLKPGTYEVEWDGTQFASGVYYYRLAAGSFTETKRMILLK